MQTKVVGVVERLDVTILYHSGKVNVVANALSRKFMENLATMITT